ncbi:hypothetical protein KRM28CT15_45020 [Krasilnikovia sp. M28-CT-15]
MLAIAVAVAAGLIGPVAWADAALAAAPRSSMRDRDHDGMPDRWERANHLNPRRNDAKADPDRDGLTNLQEYKVGSSPRRADADRDGIRDGAEDRDRDRLTNAQEFVAGTNPKRSDSDGDGISDANEDADGDGESNRDEFRSGHNPRNRDSDHDGTPDGEDVEGTIRSFDSQTGLLTVARGDHPAVTVTVTNTTVLRWEDQEDEDGGDGCATAPTYTDLTAGREVHDVKSQYVGTPAVRTALRITLKCH